MSITKNMPQMILGAILLGFIWPNPGLWLKPYLIYLLLIIMFFSCLNINIKKLKEVPKNWWRYLIILGFIFLLPTIIVYLFHFCLKDLIYIGLIITTTMPAGISIVFLSDIMSGEPHKALIITTLSHLVSPLISPFLIWLFTRKIISIDFISMIILIGKLIIIPLILAQIVKFFKKEKILSVIGGNLNLILLFLLTWSSIALARAPILSNLNQFIISTIIVLFLLIITIIFGIYFGRNQSEKITWIVAGAYKNITLASVITITMFEPIAPMMMVGIAVYSALSSILLIPLKWWGEKNTERKIDS